MKRDQALVFPVNRLEPGPNCFEVEPSTEYLELGKYHFLRPLMCNIVLTLTGHRVDMSFDIEATVEFACSQCGEPVSSKLHATNKSTFLPDSERKLEDIEVDSTDIEFYSEELDLREVVRDTFILAFPIAAICREGCKGLCPSCGTNLNYGSCNCDKTLENPKFKDLKRFVDE